MVYALTDKHIRRYFWTQKDYRPVELFADMKDRAEKRSDRLYTGAARKDDRSAVAIKEDLPFHVGLEGVIIQRSMPPLTSEGTTISSVRKIFDPDSRASNL